MLELADDDGCTELDETMLELADDDGCTELETLLELADDTCTELDEVAEEMVEGWLLVSDVERMDEYTLPE